MDDATPSAADRAARAALHRARVEAIVLLLAAVVLTLSVTLTPSDAAVVLFGWEVPPLCAWKNATGWDCLGCGLTRSFAWMGHGDLQAALGQHVLGPVLYLAVLVQVPLRLWRLWQARRRVGGP